MRIARDGAEGFESDAPRALGGEVVGPVEDGLLGVGRVCVPLAGEDPVRINPNIIVADGRGQPRVLAGEDDDGAGGAVYDACSLEYEYVGV